MPCEPSADIFPLCPECPQSTKLSCVCFSVPVLPVKHVFTDASSKADLVPLAPSVANLALDSGAGIHIVNPKDLDVVPSIHPATNLRLDTANGIIESRDATLLSIPLGDTTINAEARVLQNSPSVLSLGRLCAEQGFSLVWSKNNLPLLIDSTGRTYEVPLSSFVPILNGAKELDTLASSNLLHELLSAVEHPTPAVPVVSTFESLHDQHLRFKSTDLPSHRLLFELCCEPDSMLGQQAKSHGFFVIRVTKKHDLFDPQTLATLQELALHEQNCHAHSSVPCTPWSRLQHVNIAQAANPRLYRQTFETATSLTTFARQCFKFL